MLNQYAVDYSTFPVNQRYFHFTVILEGCEAVLGECWAATISRQIFGIRMVYRETFFVNPLASSSSLYPGGFSPWISNVTEDTSPHVTSERQNPDTTLDPRCQSGPSARNSFDPKEGRCSKDYGGRPTKTADFGTPLWQIPYATNICLLEEFLTEALLWNKEVEMVESVDDLTSSRSTKGTPGPDFELHDARIASALNKIIQYPLQSKGQSGGNESSQRRPFLSRKTDRLLDGLGDGVPKAGQEQAAADSRGSRTCVCANTFAIGVAHAGEEGWINILPWYRLVGVAKTSSETQRRKSQAAQKG